MVSASSVAGALATPSTPRKQRNKFACMLACFKIKESLQMHLLLAPLSSQEDEEAFATELAVYADKLNIELDGKAQIAQVNLGLGADWIVIGLQISVATLLIPELHKRIRESIEECRKMHQELTSLIRSLAGERRILSLPKEVLYLTALEKVLSQNVHGDVKLVAIEDLPVPSEVTHGTSLPRYHLFIFGCDEQMALVAVSSTGEIVWNKRLFTRAPK
jgi:hypothetical protein